MSENKESNFYKKSWRLSNLYKITDEKGRTVIFKRNKAQQYVSNIRMEWRNNNPGKPLRFIILKGRQQGMTTDACIDKLDEAMVKSNRNITIVAHQLKKQQEIFQKVQYAYDNYPPMIQLNDGKIFIKPKTKLENVNQLFFKEKNSQIKVSLDSRSGTNTDLHITELSSRRDAEDMMAGTLPAALSADITIETTAKGVGNYFHNLWVDNYNNPQGAWVCIFLGWWLTPRYAMPLDEGEILDLPTELSHLNKIVTEEGLHLTEEQKKRYYENYKTLKKKMFQEFPSSPEEAFLNSGDTVRDLSVIKNLPNLQYTVDKVYRNLRIYRPPSGLCMYGIDTSEGGANGDYSAISVRDINMNLLAFYYDKMPPDELVKVIRYLFVDLGYIGVIAPERNNTGLTTISKLKEDPILYSFLLEEETVDKKNNTITKKYGRHTNSKSRPLMTGEYEEAIREGYIDEIDDRHKGELYTFVYDDNKKMIATKGCHDDAIMSDAICYQMRNYIHRYMGMSNLSI